MEHMILPHHHKEHIDFEDLQKELGQLSHFQIVAETFRQLSDPTRVRLFWLLCHCEECVINLAQMLEMSSPAVSHHLRELKNTNLITGRREGKEVYYKAADNEQSKLLHLMIEQVMEIACPHSVHSGEEHPSKLPADQLKTIQQIHHQLISDLSRRYTIEELSKQYLMNPTTLKSAFKEVYGDSIATHVKIHRLEHAAALLAETSDPIQDIAGQVGYESQSKFTSAFREKYGCSPSEYRKEKKIY